MQTHPADEGLLGWLDSPRLVVGAFGFFLVGLCFLGFLLYVDQRKQVKRIDEIVQEHRATQKAADAQTVNRCFASASNAPALAKVLKALQEVLTEPDARAALHNFSELNTLNANTPAECRALAHKLNVPIPKGVR